MRYLCEKLFLSIIVYMLCLSAHAGIISIDASTMTPSGKYASLVTSPFAGVALYTNGDQAVKNVDFEDGNAVYNISVTGASSNSSAAGVSLYVDGVKVDAFSFSGTEETTKTSQKKVYLSSANVEVKLLLETDNGSNDTFVKTITFEMVKPIVDRPAPTLPAQGTFDTGIYRNLVKEAGFTDEEINARLKMLWDTYFAGDAENERVYYETGEGDAYILDVNNDDVRSEGMSYGMMICVQMDKKEEFDKLWKFVKDRMIIKTGAAKGYISWQIKKDGSSPSAQCAPDGDEYMAMALMFAAGRWGSDGNDYWTAANDILNNSISKDNLINSSVVNMFNETEQQVVFVPYASSAKHTDPSYHMPAFYTLWSKWANYNRQFWAQLADRSRAMYPKFADSTTGLMPDYASFSGTPTGSGHQEFRYDAWRCAMHMGNDYAWFAESANEVEQVDKLFTFFESEGITSYGSEYALNGRKLTADHSPGLVACNAAGALASTKKCVWDIMDDVQGASLTTGRYRYYDGMLYFLGYLHATGNFRMYKPADVLDIALDEQYKYDEDYLIIDDYETIPEGYNYYMRMTESSPAKAFVDANPADASQHALHIRPGNYDEFYYLKYTLPKGETLSGNYSQMEFDVYYNPEGDNNNQTLKVCIDNYNSPIYTESTGAKATQGVWKHVVVPITGTYDNKFKLFIGVRTRNADFYIDNLKLLKNGGTSTIKVNGVSLNKQEATLKVGDTMALTATVTPNDATDSSVTWSTSNDGVATVGSNGLVTAVSAGTATITVTTTDGEYTATCQVIVSDNDDPTPPTPESDINNLVDDDSYGFEKGNTGKWNSWGNSSSRGVDSPGYGGSSYCMKLTNPSAGSDYYVAQAGYEQSMPLVNGTTYKLRFKAKAATEGGSIQFCYQNSSTYEGGGYLGIDLTTDWKVYEYDITVSKDDMNRIIFSFGKTVGTFYIDEIEFGVSDGSTTGINHTRAMSDNVIYDIMGRRVDSKATLKPGIYIVNGKKTIRK